MKEYSNAYYYAKAELENHFSVTPDSVLKEFEPELLSLAEKFGKSGQSGGSAPFVISAISTVLDKILSFQPIEPVTGEKHEWIEVDDGVFQNRRASAIFKQGENGRAYYLDAMVKQTKNSRWFGSFFRDRFDMINSRSGCDVEKIGSRAFIKSFPFVPKIFVIDVIEEEVAKDDWEMYMVDPKQLEEVEKYYDLYP